MTAKSDGARQYLKRSACGREFNGAPILGKGYKLLQRNKNVKKGIDKWYNRTRKKGRCKYGNTQR